MKTLLKLKWPIFIAWIIMAGVLFASMPNLGELVRTKGQTSIPEAYKSYQANQLIQELNNNTGQEKEMPVIIVFHEDVKLNDQQIDDIDRGIAELEKRTEALGITNILSHTSNEDAKDQLIAKDGTTILTGVSIQRGERSSEEVRNQLSDVLTGVKVPHYLTGSDLITEDFIKTTQSGVKKTEGVAVLFIIVVLIIIFRSPVAPIISLISVALTYLASLGIVSQLVDKLNFPFSNFTQIFLLLVLFGIGTDYNILLFMRFKEELTKQATTLDAITQTYKTAGKTVLYSGMAVFIGFSTLGLAEFKLFKSASAVGIGVGVLMVALFTVVPVFMGLLGKKLFWPSNAASGHKENRLTSAITKAAVKKPLIGILGSLVISLSAILFYNGQLSYNSLEEIKESYPSVKGINLVYDHFPQGQALPSTFVLKYDEPLDTSSALAFVDKATEMIGSIDGVDKVYSATRPQGEIIPELYTNDQSAKLSEGVGRADEGIGTIKTGLDQAITDINAVKTEDFDKVSELVSGTKEIQQGIDQATDALNQIGVGMNKGVQGAEQLQSGVQNLNLKLTSLTQSTNSLVDKLQTIHSGYDMIYSQYQKIESSLVGIFNTSQAVNEYILILEVSNEELSTNADFLALKQTSAGLSEQLKLLSYGFSRLNQQLNATNQKLTQIKQGLEQINNGQKKILEGSKQIEANTGALKTGLSQSSEGQQKVLASLPQLSDGLLRINQGQSELDQGLSMLDDNISKLATGLGDSVNGLNEISDGLTSATDYLDEVTQTGSSETFFIPEEVRTGVEFTKSLDAYMSEDRHSMKWTVILSEDPYSTEAMQTIDHIDQEFQALVRGTPYEHASYGIAGISSQNHDLETVNTGDFTRTAIIMLVGIIIVLFAITRSFWIPVMIIVSLVLAYYTSLAVTELIFRTFTAHAELTWTIPFFAFIMVVALGVDYSIFLMMRYREYKNLSAQEAILEAIKHTSGVIVSAVIILSGTFAAMYPSGVLTLIQLSTAVIIALMLLAFIFLPLFLPAFISLTNRTKPHLLPKRPV
ncbi:MMPL family transporter [Paenibacillus apii]|uniref:MMPL family transporter n=1 Tax=Paenibacillus apii TaxID=1850370 RepID=UPI0014399EF9|nr:MMPL family transporter [Paenibacillus apii]NJJ41856.1 MMPL family transporter [Paenibacillus apii]